VAWFVQRKLELYDRESIFVCARSVPELGRQMGRRCVVSPSEPHHLGGVKDGLCELCLWIPIWFIRFEWIRQCSLGQVIFGVVKNLSILGILFFWVP
jgi:hypothetical protein